MIKKKYFFTIGAIFKNESHILKEWIDHYFFHGAQHIYLINDESNDNYLEILKPYIKKKKITLHHTNKEFQGLGKQKKYYNFFFKKYFKDTEWMAILDLDEFLYSPLTIDIKNIIKKYENFAQLEVNWVHFGSSGFENHPEKIVKNFIYRGEYNSKKNGPDGRYNSYKTIVKTSLCKLLEVHKHRCRGALKNISFNKKKTPLLINHYAIQSKEYWQKIKMTRGDVNDFYDHQKWERDMKLFEEMDNNEIKDERLKNQNKDL